MNDLQKVKERALACLDKGELADAVEALADGIDWKINPHLMMLGILYVQQDDAAAVRRWIEGFR